MKKILLLSTLVLAAAALHAQGDGLPRERRPGHPSSAEKDAAEGKWPPGLGATNWQNTHLGRDVQLGELRGKVVLVLFFGTWNRPSCEAVKDAARLYGELHDQGLEIIAIHSQLGGAQMKAFVEENAIPFPVALDARGETLLNFSVDDYPDYWLIDRGGKVRVADLGGPGVAPGVRELLREPVPTTNFVYPKRLVTSWPSARYRISENGEPLGWWRTSVALVEEDGRERLRLHDSFQLGEASAEVAQLCDVSVEMKPVRLTRGPLATDGGAPVELAFEQDRTRGSKELTFTTPPLTELTLLRGPRLSFRKHESLTFDHLSVLDLELTRGWKLTCAGEEQLAVAGRTVAAWRFDLESPSGKGSLWYGRERQLLRMVLGPREWLLEAFPR